MICIEPRDYTRLHRKEKTKDIAEKWVYKSLTKNIISAVITMDSMVEVIRKIVESEIRKLRIAELGVVTSIFPHSSDSDKDNYECNIQGP